MGLGAGTPGPSRLHHDGFIHGDAAEGDTADPTPTGSGFDADTDEQSALGASCERDVPGVRSASARGAAGRPMRDSRIRGGAIAIRYAGITVVRAALTGA